MLTVVSILLFIYYQTEQGTTEIAVSTLALRIKKISDSNWTLFIITYTASIQGQGHVLAKVW